MTAVDLSLHLFSLGLITINLCAKEFLLSIVREILQGSQNSKLSHVTLTWPLLTKFWIFFVTTHCNPSFCQIWSF